MIGYCKKWDNHAAFVNLHELLGNKKKSIKHENKVREIVDKIDDELKVGVPI